MAIEAELTRSRRRIAFYSDSLRITINKDSITGSAVEEKSVQSSSPSLYRELQEHQHRAEALRVCVCVHVRASESHATVRMSAFSQPMSAD